jgi:hypothetical protein
MMPMQTVHGGMGNGGHLYIQTNESHNAVIHYRRSANGAIPYNSSQGLAGF